MIGFNTIPATIGVPGSYTEFDATGARSASGGKPYKLLVYGQMDAAKTASYVNGSTALADVPVQVQSQTAAATLFGAGSILEKMLASIFKTNTQNEVWVVPQYDDAASIARLVKADYNIPYATPATISGVEHIYIGEQDYRVLVTVGDTATIIVANLAAAINADIYSLFVASAAGGALSLTAKNKGALANDVQIVAQYYGNEVSPAGTFVTFNAATQGAQNPSIAAGIASVASDYFTHVVLPYNDTANYQLLLADAQDRWSPLPGATSIGNGQQDYIVFCAYRGAESQVNTFMAAGRNSEYFTTAAIEPPQLINGIQYGGLMSSTWQYAAAYGALSAKLASVVCNNPIQARVLACLKPAPRPCRFTWNERNRTILNYGCSTYTYNEAGQLVVENGVTENLTTSNGAPTDAERRVETQLAKSYLRWSLNAMLQTVYPHHRLADDGTPGLPNNVATPKMVIASVYSLAKNDWVAKGIIENYAAFVQSGIVERSVTECNTLNLQIFPDLVNILVVKANKISYFLC